MRLAGEETETSKEPEMAEDRTERQHRTETR